MLTIEKLIQAKRILDVNKVPRAGDGNYYVEVSEYVADKIMKAQARAEYYHAHHRRRYVAYKLRRLPLLKK
jgi:hypothetical protein